MRATYRKRIKQLHDDGFSTSELAIMYKVSEYQINLVLEENDMTLAEAVA